MSPWLRKSLSTLLALLLSVSACGPTDPGERVWVRRCAGCHGADGKGKAKYVVRFPYANLTDGRHRHGTDREAIRRLVADGGRPESPMPAFRDRLSPAEIDAVTGLVLQVYSGTGLRAAPTPAPRAR